jgi:hypothetical protein
LETNNSASRYRKKKTEKTILLILRSRTFSHSLDPKREVGGSSAASPAHLRKLVISAIDRVVRNLD